MCKRTMFRSLLLRTPVGVFLLVLLLLPCTSTEAAGFPSKDLTCVVGFRAGGGYDFYARAVSKILSKYLPGNPTVIVKNRTGAGGRIAAIETYRAKPDGYTFAIWGIEGLYIIQLAGETKYDLNKVTWLGKVTEDTLSLAVSPLSPIRSVADLKKAKECKVAITGFASASSMMAALAMENLGAKAVFVSGHKRSEECIVAAIRGDVDAVMLSSQTLIPYYKKKELIPILQFGKTKDPGIAGDVPNGAEVGHPELDKIIKTVRGFGAPPGIPADRVKILRDAMWKALNDPELAKLSEQTGRRISIATGEELEQEVHDGLAIYDKYKKTVVKYLQ